MLPEIRRDEGLYPVPQYEIEKVDITGFMDELREFHATFHDGFSRSEPRKNFFRYMVGQLSDLERKSIEPIALHVEGGNPRRMQSAITDALWDEDKMLSNYHTLVHLINDNYSFRTTTTKIPVRRQLEFPPNDN